VLLRSMVHGPFEAAGTVRKFAAAPAGDIPIAKQLALIPMAVNVAAALRPVLNAEF